MQCIVTLGASFLFDVSAQEAEVRASVSFFARPQSCIVSKSAHPDSETSEGGRCLQAALLPQSTSGGQKCTILLRILPLTCRSLGWRHSMISTSCRFPARSMAFPPFRERQKWRKRRLIVSSAAAWGLRPPPSIPRRGRNASRSCWTRVKMSFALRSPADCPALMPPQRTRRRNLRRSTRIRKSS